VSRVVSLAVSASRSDKAGYDKNVDRKQSETCRRVNTVTVAGRINFY